MNKKIIILAIVVVVLVSILTACQKNEVESGGNLLSDIDEAVLKDLVVEADSLSQRDIDLLSKTNDTLLRDFTLPDFNGKNHTLSEYKGEVIILNFWAVGCPPCVKEMPDFNKVGNKDGVVLVTVAQRNVLGNEKTASGDFIKGFDSVALWDEDLKTQSLYPSQYYPHTYIIDRSGTVRFVLNSASYELLTELVTFCDEKFN